MYKFSTEAFLAFIKTLVPLLGLELAEGVPNLLIFVYLGQFGDPIPIAAYGVSIFLKSVVVLPIIFSLVEVSGVIFSVGYGAQRYDEIINYFYRSIFTLCIFLAGYTVFVFYTEELFIKINISKEIAIEAAYLCQWSVISIGLNTITMLFQAFMCSQGKAHEFITINFGSMFLGAGFCAIFILYFEMKHIGVIPGLIIQEAACAIYTIYVYFTKVDPRTVGKPKLKRMIKGYWYFFVKVLINTLGTFIEWATFEINTFLAIQLKNPDELAVFLSWTGFSNMFYVFGFAFSSTTRVIIGRLIGEKRHKEAKTRLIQIFSYIIGFGVINAVLLVVFHHPIGMLYFNNQELADSFSKMVLTLIPSQLAYMMIFPFFQIFRIIEMEWFFDVILGTYFLLSNTLLAIVLGFYYELNSLGLVIAHGFAAISTVAIFGWKIFLSLDWSEVATLETKSQTFLETEMKLLDL